MLIETFLELYLSFGIKVKQKIGLKFETKIMNSFVIIYYLYKRPPSGFVRLNFVAACVDVEGHPL